jgi:H+/Cl- antiporter ClcA/predicted transcriptional regulator
MERVLVNQSRIPARVTFLKPASAAIAIGTGGPFGAEGPIIATGSALGSLFGQIIATTVSERKTLLAAGAAAGMAATFGSPVSAVLLAIELLLFEYRPRSIVPVALASSAATGTRIAFEGMGPMFPMPDLSPPTGGALAAYVLVGAVMGVAAVGVTRILYQIEDWFDMLPIHWMWWPAFGGLAVGIFGWIAPRTLGIGYGNITDCLAGRPAVGAVLLFTLLKFLSWSLSLGSGTSGGTMAPLFTVGAGLGLALGAAASALMPGLHIDVRVAALVGMASLFAGAARAMLACAVFAFETTLQPFGLLPLLGGCAASYLVSSLLMRNSMMTEKIARRGIRAPAEYVADILDQVLVRDVATSRVVSFKARDKLGDARQWLASGAVDASHQGFPLLNENGVLVGLLTRRDLLNPQARDDQELSSLVHRSLKYVYDDCTVQQAANHMVNHHIGRLPVVRRSNPREVVGIITRSDILSVFERRITEAERQSPTIRLGAWRRPRSESPG